jgi:hypothetical protein
MSNARLLALLLSFVSLVAPSTARSDDHLLDLFKKHSHNVLSCEPKVLHDDSILTIRMPEPHGDFLVIASDWHQIPVHVVYPRPRWPLMLKAAKFRTLSTVSWKVRDIRGVFYGLQNAFWTTGRHAIFVGSGFDTPNPIVDGWCEVEYVESDPPRPSNRHSPGPYREGEAWNKMKCSPSTVTRDSVLTINMPYPHGSYLAVFPDGNYAERDKHFIYPATAHPAVEGFYRMRSLSIRVNDIRVWENGRRRPVFDKPGRYMINLGSHFETDGGPTIEGWCRVILKR